MYIVLNTKQNNKSIDRADEKIEFTLKISMMEIYMEKIRDLLQPKLFSSNSSNSNNSNNSNDGGGDLKIRMNSKQGVYVDGLSEHFVTSDEQVIHSFINTIISHIQSPLNRAIDARTRIHLDKCKSVLYSVYLYIYSFVYIYIYYRVRF